MKIKHVVFDLDGTLVDSNRTIYEATMKTFQKLKWDVDLPQHELDKRLGKHFKDIFRELDIPIPDLEHFIDVYKSLYSSFLNLSQLYPNVEEVLSYLKENNIKVSLLTTKAQDQSDMIVDYFNLRKYFDFILGRRNGLGYKPSPEPLWFICNNLSVLPKETLMVGDSELDIQCGKNAGAKTCAVTYGYRDLELLEIEKPDFLIASLGEIKKILI